MQYPVLEHLSEIIAALEKAPIAVLQAPPGTGKSTVLPLHLLRDYLSPNGSILMLEPRRLAARAVASRMSVLSKEPVGNAIGYQVRFENKSSRQTRIKVVTDGIMTRLLQQDQSLEGVELVIFDEFHERSLQADLALALCRQVQELLRPDLRILIMSATLDAETLSETLGQAPVITAQGTAYPVAVEYAHAPVSQPVWKECVPYIHKALRKSTGDVLVFLPGSAEISRTKKMLEESESGNGMAIHSLYGDLALSQQQAALEPDHTGKRKVIMATSIAETSLTIDGVQAVVDAGLQRLPFFEARTGLTRMETVRVTRDAAEQRAGRAGRQGPGLCLRMWTASEQHQLPDQRKPEIQEADLATLVLELAQWGVTRPDQLMWVTPPPAHTWEQARKLLESLEALDNRANITEKGTRMAGLPTHPRLAHMLLEAGEAASERETLLALACDIAAILEERDLFDRSQSADISLRIDVLRSWRRGERTIADYALLERIEKLSRTWRVHFNVQPDNTPSDAYATGRLLFSAYPERLAQALEINSGRYKLRTGNMVTLREGDGLSRSGWIVAAHVDAGTVKAGGIQEGRVYLGAPVHPDDFKSFVTESVTVDWDDEREAVTGLKEHRIGNLVLRSQPVDIIPTEMRTGILLKTIRQKGMRFLEMPDSAIHLLNRLQSVHIWQPEDAWPDVSEERLLSTLETWLMPYSGDIRTASQLRKLHWDRLFSALIPWQLHPQLEEIAPKDIGVPSGSRIMLHYFKDGKAPVMEVRLQELFGLAETPTVNYGKIPVMLHLLSPGFKPVQVTQDLRSFWNTTYFEVKKELRMRYPKHSWPDDPWTAEAVRGAKKRRV
jgi:ATP-dependent helicase HrpB